MLFTQEELVEIKNQAKQEAAKLLKARLIEKALEEADEPAIEHGPVIDLGSLREEWVIAPTPTDEETFGEVHIYGCSLRVNRSGTKVELLVDGNWTEKAISRDANARRTPFVILSNGMCAGSRGKTGKVSLPLARLALQAFTDIPDYIAAVMTNPNGPRILFGLSLYRFKDGNTQNVHTDNLSWVKREDFLIAMRKKLSGLKAKSSAV